MSLSKIYIFPRSVVHFTDVNMTTAQRHTWSLNVDFASKICSICIIFLLYQWLSKITLRKPFVIQIAYPFRTVFLVTKLVKNWKIATSNILYANFLLLKSLVLVLLLRNLSYMVTWWAINQQPLLRAFPQCNPSFLFVIFCRGSCCDFNSSPNGRLF